MKKLIFVLAAVFALSSFAFADDKTTQETENKMTTETPHGKHETKTKTKNKKKGKKDGGEMTTDAEKETHTEQHTEHHE